MHVLDSRLSRKSQVEQNSPYFSALHSPVHASLLTKLSTSPPAALVIKLITNCTAPTQHDLHRVHTSQEKFENGDFTLKTHLMFSVHTMPEKTQENNIIGLYHTMLKQKILPVQPLIQCEAGRAKTKLFVPPGTQNGRRVIKVYYPDLIVFKKLLFQNAFRLPFASRFTVCKYLH